MEFAEPWYTASITWIPSNVMPTPQFGVSLILMGFHQRSLFASTEVKDILMVTQVAQLEFHSVTSDRWKDFEKLFGPNGACAGCWCMWWRMSRAEFSQKHYAGNKRAIKKICTLLGDYSEWEQRGEERYHGGRVFRLRLEVLLPAGLEECRIVFYFREQRSWERQRTRIMSSRKLPIPSGESYLRDEVGRRRDAGSGSILPVRLSLIPSPEFQDCIMAAFKRS